MGGVVSKREALRLWHWEGQEDAELGILGGDQLALEVG